MEIPGLTVENILDEETCKEYFDLINSYEWDSKLKRKTQQYGYEYKYVGRNSCPQKTKPPTKFLKCLTKILKQKGLFGEDSPNQIIINKYLPGEGIGAHTDHEKFFDTKIFALSLGWEYDMVFKKKNTRKKVIVSLPVGSLITMEGDARYKWTHEIPARKKATVWIDKNGKYHSTDPGNGAVKKSISRPERISITWRTVFPQFCKV